MGDSKSQEVPIELIELVCEMQAMRFKTSEIRKAVRDANPNGRIDTRNFNFLLGLAKEHNKQVHSQATIDARNNLLELLDSVIRDNADKPAYVLRAIDQKAELLGLKRLAPKTSSAEDKAAEVREALSQIEGATSE